MGLALNTAFVSQALGGGAGGTRTPYLFNAIEALSQLSYSPTATKYSTRRRGYTLGFSMMANPV